MSTFYPNCGECNRTEERCICGAKRGYFKCAICESDVLASGCAWASVDQPVHKECLEAVKAEASEPGPNGTLPELDTSEGMKAVHIPLQFMLTVPVQDNEEPDARIKFAVQDFLSNVILAYNGATFERTTEADYPQPAGQIKVSNFKLEEILEAAAQAEQHRRERLQQGVAFRPNVSEKD